MAKKRPISEINFCCPICGCNRYIPIYKRKDEKIVFDPIDREGIKSADLVPICDYYICAKCTVHFDDIQKFTNSNSK
ncbi:MAG: hypothetical protein WC928_00235 [Patescibacteria group bacterium]|jgi:hypothetical protein